jgi:hypothetical protein
MTPRNNDALPTDDLSYICSRRYEDYLDWLENQNRPWGSYFGLFRALVGAVVGGGVLVWVGFLAV